MRLLVITQNWDYTNPSTYLLINELSTRQNVIVAGWGYSSNINRIKEFSARFGRVDVALIDPWVLSKGGKHDKFYNGIRPVDILECGVPLILNLLQYDLHNLTLDFKKNYVESCDAVISSASSPQFWKSDIARYVGREPFLRAVDPGFLSRMVDGKFLLIPHSVAESEFHDVKAMRKHDAMVLGAPYSFRREARRVLSKQKDIRAKVECSNIQKVLGRLSSNYYYGKYLFATRLYRKAFSNVLRCSKVGITCDGTIGYPIRKFFEIPAAGAMLVGQFFNDAEALGFRDGENGVALSLERISELPDIVRWARSDAVDASRITRAGQEMVLELHTVRHRADQLLEVAGEVAQGRRVRTRWVGGKQVLMSEAESAVGVEQVS